MAKTISIKNPPLPNKEETFLSSKYTAGGVALTVRDDEGWADNDIAVVGKPGQERTENGLVGGVTGASQINLDATLRFDHLQDTPIFRSDYNQISLERKPSGGSFTEIAEGKFTIEWDERDGYSKVPVAAGVDSDTFRWRFYNSLTGSYSDYSAELPGTGLTTKHAGYIIKLIRLYAKIPADLAITDLDILDILNRGQLRIDTLAPNGGRWWFALVEDDNTSRVQAVADTYKYDLPSNFRAMDVVKCLDTNSEKYNLNWMSLIEFDQKKQNDEDTGTHNNATSGWTLMAPDSSNTIGYFGIHPTPVDTTNYFYRRYWRFLPALTTFASQTLVPLPELLFNWGMHSIYLLREDSDNALLYKGFFDEGITMLTRLQRRQIGQLELQRFRGQRGYQDLFGGVAVESTDEYRESHW